MPYSAEYEQLTRQIAAEQFPDDPRSAAVFFNMIKQECAFDSDVITGVRDSPAGARGIAQLMPVHWSAVDPLDPPAALRYAAGFLRRLTARYHDLRAAVASYNWGPGNMDRAIAQWGPNWESSPDLPAETRRYLDAAFAGISAQADGDHEGGHVMYRDPSTGWLLPAAGPITQGFGPTDEQLDGPATYNGVTYPHFNRGIDIGCAVGTEVYAVRSGKVIWSGFRNRAGQPVDDGTGWGMTVWVQEDDGVIHNYGHLSTTTVNVGDTVQRGTLVGRSGNSGASTGPHLSYDIFRIVGGELAPIDPVPYLSAGDGGVAEPVAGITATITAENGLRLRTDPSDNAAIISVVPRGTKVTLPRAAWYPVRWNGNQGWMWGEFLSFDTPAPPAPAPPQQQAVLLMQQVLTWASSGDKQALAALKSKVDELLSS